MKTNLFMALAFAFLMLFAACTEEKIIYIEKDNGIEVLPGEGVIKVSLSNDLQTRAARPIGSSEAGNNVNRIKFEFYNHNGGSLVTDNVAIDGAYDENGDKLNNFNVDNTQSVLILPDNNSTKKFYVKFSSLPDKGSYTIIVYGYNCGDESNDFPYNTTYTYPTGKRAYRLSEGIEPNNVEEIFAGYCTTTTSYIGINQYNMFSTPVSVELKRQVAGLMAYLCNVPAEIDTKTVDKITISTPAKMNGFKFPASGLDNMEYNGIKESENNIDLLTFTIRDSQEKYYSNISSNGFYEFNDNYLLADGMTKTDFTNLICRENTLFGSCFLLPYSNAMDFYNTEKKKATLYLTYYTLENDAYNEIKSVNLKNSNPSEEYHEYNYNIRCNHFYSVGGKKDVENTEEDNPLDISDETGYKDVFLTINDIWDETLNLIK